MDRPDIHTYFSLSYANYLVLNRTLLQSMPIPWQQNFVELLQEMDKAFSEITSPDHYQVTAVDRTGKYTKNPIPHYDRGRARVEPRLGD